MLNMLTGWYLRILHPTILFIVQITCVAAISGKKVLYFEQEWEIYKKSQGKAQKVDTNLISTKEKVCKLLVYISYKLQQVWHNNMNKTKEEPIFFSACFKY